MPPTSDRPAPAADDRDAALHIDLRTGGIAVRLRFSPALARLAEETRALWSHALVEGDVEPATDAERATDDGPSAAPLVFAAPGEDVSVHAGDGAGSGVRTHRIAPDDPNASFEISGLVTTAVIRQLLGTRLLLHAGAVEHPDLGTVLVVGPSGAGKSTSTVALGQGATYLTDELTILDPHDRKVTAHPKPVSRVVRPEADPAAASGTEAALASEPAPASGSAPASEPAPASGTAGRHKRDFPLADLGLRPGLTGAAPSHVLILDRQGDAGAPVPVSARRTPPGEALHVLVAQSSSTWRVTRGLARLTEMLDDVGGALTVRYTEASDLVRQLPDLVREPALRTPWRHARGRRPDAPAAGHHAVAPFADAIVFEDSVAVLTEGRLVTIDGLGALLWDVLEMDGPLTTAALLETLTSLLGDDPQAAAHMEAALSSLRDEGLLAPEV